MSLIVSRDRTGAARTIRMGLASRQALVAYIFLLPALIYFAVFFFYPIIQEVYVSLLDNATADFVGLRNYVQALQDPRVLNSFKVTVIFAASVTIASIVVGLGLAMLLDQPLRGRAVLRAIFLVPYLSSAIIVGLMWRNILDPLTGILNRVLLQYGLPQQDWLSNYNLALPAVIAITVWQGAGYTMVLFLAGLQNIPQMYYEAARVDGAGPWARFRRITLPLLAPTTLFVSIISVIGSLQGFTQAYVITQGGPAEATRFYVYHVFNVAFNENNIAYSSALTFLMFIAILVLTIIQMRLGNRAVEY
ncbi:MAG: sugar ABC transporter permease [Ktedonobacteraceae bacterium]|nr:sugar ABC transporter permease [Ktedonobacteraceae bacterium]MBO0792410.1 sugar ABC transporter permease [Ktedonobacteraceae bacterium]